MVYEEEMVLAAKIFDQVSKTIGGSEDKIGYITIATVLLALKKKESRDKYKNNEKIQHISGKV